MTAPAMTAAGDMQFAQPPPLPMLTLDDGASEFDYGAFLQDEDVDYLAEDSSASSHTLNDSSPPAVNAQPSTSVVNSGSSSNQRQRLERRGHTKSRRGCFNCKRRRIKCQESRPACGHCVKTGLKCEYPSAPQIVHQPQHQIPLFSLQDMRFFQHFLFSCIPHHPIGSESVWTHEIPCLSEKYEYLMHAILGLAASDLTQKDPNLVAAAMHHRVKAIKAIKKTLADVPKGDSFEEGNAMMATCFALTFQSVLLDDGMAEYMTFIRGVVIVAIQMYLKGARLVFADFLGEKQQDALQPFMEPLPLIEQSWVTTAIAALNDLAPLCQQSVEKQYHERLLEMAKQLTVSSWAGYKSMTQQYGWWMMLPHDEFQKIIDTTNQVNILLCTHWIAIQQIMGSITQTEYQTASTPRKPRDGGVEVGILRWLKYLNKLVDAQHAVYNQWPVWVEAQLDRNPSYFGRTR